MHAEPMINVRDVETSSRWYQELLGASSGHGGKDFEMLIHGGQLMLMLHDATGADHHPHIEEQGPAGRGVVLYFRVGQGLADAVDRAREMGADIRQGPRWNELAHQEELWVRDPDGYTVVLAGPADWAK